MKQVLFMLMSFLMAASVAAQGMFSNETNTVLETVLKDYPFRFSNIKGEALTQAGNIKTFKSTVQVQGSLSSSVYIAGAAGREGVRWTTVLFTTPDFNQGTEKFRQLFDQLNNTIIKINNQKPLILSGKYQEPSPGSETIISFSLLPSMGEIKKVKTLLALTNRGNTWSIVLSVYDRSAQPF